MKTKYILKSLLYTILLSLTVYSCGYNEDVIEDLDTNREFAPIELKATVRNQIAVELNWKVRNPSNSYIVEFSANDPEFNTISKTLEVTPNQLPIRVELLGETVYSIRVKAVSATGLEDSKWVTTVATTLSEQIMLPSIAGDIAALEATLRWAAGSNVTKIVLTPGDITHEITNQEKADGIATISGLNPETSYQALLFNNDLIRGSATFLTGINIGNNTLVTPDDDLFQMIANAASGSILLLEKGDYTAQIGTISLNKSITIQGLRSDFKPKLKVGFSIVSGAANISLIDLDLEGGGPTLDQTNDVVKYAESGSYGNLLISGCNIHNYKKSLVFADLEFSTVNSVTIENTIVTDIWCNGSDFIDFRKANIRSLNINSSTFNNVASSTATGARDFIRIDETGTTGTGLTTAIVLENNTLHNVSDNAVKRIFYVRYVSNTITANNNIFSGTLAIYSNQAKTSVPNLSNNNYFNAPSFTNASLSNNKIDTSSTYTSLDPGFVNAASGNFKITDQTLLDNQIGDPRWRL